MVVAAIVASGGTLVPSHADPGLTFRVSQTVDGKEPNGPTPAETVSDTSSPEMSLDGRWVAFSSDASNLVPGDTNLAADVFVRDLQTRRITRASLTATGAQGNDASHSPSMSVDGRYLAFVSAATNLVPGDTNGKQDVFLKDLRTGAISIVSRAGARLGNGDSLSPFVSLFGDYVTFESSATNLAAGDGNGLSDAFIRDVKRNRLERIAPPSVPSQTAIEVTTWTETPQISYEGRYASFVRGATYGSPLTPIAMDVFILDRVTRKAQQVKLPPWGSSAKVMAANPVLSANGRIVAFEAWSAIDYDDSVVRKWNPPHELERIDNNDALVRNPLDHQDIYFYDRVVKAVGYVSVNSWNQPTAATTTNTEDLDPSRVSANADSYDPVISADGSVIAFASDASNLVAGDTNRATDIFVRDLRERFCRPNPPVKGKKQPDTCQVATSRVSLGGTASQADALSARPTMSYDGRRIAFASAATNLVGGDGNRATDVFARDRRTDTRNGRPDLAPISGVRTVSGGDEVRLQLRAKDPERDPLRYSVIMGMPVGAQIDPTTGVFTWKTTPVNRDRVQERSYDIIFWVDDPRGAGDIELAKFVVRDLNQTARCRVGIDRNC